MSVCAASSAAAAWRCNVAGIDIKIVRDLDETRLRVFVNNAENAARVVNAGYPQGAEEKDGTSLAMIAAVHNFGSPERGIPERPFMTTAVHQAQAQVVELNRRNILKIIQGEMTTETALGQLGALAVGAIQKSIKSGDWAPLAQATIDRKGSSKPLYDTGQMLQSTTFVIEPKK